MLKLMVLLGVFVVSSTAYADTLFERILGALKLGMAKRRQSGSCKVNVCFAIDGSDNLDEWQFRIQRDLVRGVVQEISESNKIGVAGVQYGITNNVITPLTEDVGKFLKELRGSRFIEAPLSFTGAGVVYCHAQLRDDESRKGVMVLLGTGEWDIGGNPGERADLFRKDGGKVIGVGVGDSDFKSLNEIANGNENVFYLRRRSEIGEVVDDVVDGICG